MQYGAFKRLVLQHYEYLWNEYGFTIVEEFQDLGYFTMEIVARAGSCNFTFLVDRGHTGEVLVGTSMNLDGNAVTDQYSVQTLIQFLMPEPRSEGGYKPLVAVPEELSGDQRIETALRELAVVIQPHCGQIVRLFQVETYPSVRQSLKRFYEHWLTYISCPSKD